MAAVRVASILAGAWLGLACVVWGMAALLIFDLDVLFGVGTQRRKAYGRRAIRRARAGAPALRAISTTSPAGSVHAEGVGQTAGGSGGPVRGVVDAVTDDGLPAQRPGESRSEWVERVRAAFEDAGIPVNPSPAPPRLRIVKREPVPFEPELFAHVRQPFRERE